MTLQEALLEKAGPCGPYKFIFKHEGDTLYAPFYSFQEDMELVAKSGLWGWGPAGTDPEIRRVIQEFNCGVIRDLVPTLASLSVGVKDKPQGRGDIVMDIMQLKEDIAGEGKEARAKALWDLADKLNKAKLDIYDVFLVLTDRADPARFDHPIWATVEAAFAAEQHVRVLWHAAYSEAKEVAA